MHLFIPSHRVFIDVYLPLFLFFNYLFSGHHAILICAQPLNNVIKSSGAGNCCRLALPWLSITRSERLSFVSE